MRLLEYIILNEAKSLESIVDILRRDCRPFLNEWNENKYGLLYRGSHSHKNTIVKIKSRLKDRMAKDTPSEVHDVLNKIFVKEFGWKVRNGVFATADDDTTCQYGYTYHFFPIGKYKYAWSPKITDLYSDKIDNTDVFNELYGIIRDPVNSYFGYIRPDKAFWCGDPVKGYWADSKTKLKVGRGTTDIIRKMDKEFDYDYIDNFEKDYDKKRLLLRFYKSHFDIKKQKYFKEFIWVSDLSYKDYLKDNDKRIKDYVNKIVKSYKDTGLNAAIRSGSEISFKCDEYYLVDADIYSKEGDDLFYLLTH